MKIDLKSQKDFFDSTQHRAEADVILSPPQAHQWEYQQLLESLKTKKPSQTVVVELGSGTGRLTFELLRRGYQVIAYDISSESLKKLQKIYQKHKQLKWGKLTTTNQLPKNKIADAIVGCDILHHVPMPETLVVWKKLLKPNGLALFSEPNAFNLLWYLHLLINKIPWEIERGLLQCWPGNLRQVFKAAGFNKSHIYGHGLLPTPIPLPINMAKSNALNWAKTRPNLAFRLQIQAS